MITVTTVLGLGSTTGDSFNFGSKREGVGRVRRDSRPGMQVKCRTGTGVPDRRRPPKRDSHAKLEGSSRQAIDEDEILEIYCTKHYQDGVEAAKKYGKCRV